MWCILSIFIAFAGTGVLEVQLQPERADARVTLHCPGHSQTLITPPTGAVTFTRVPAGQCGLSVYHSRYRPILGRIVQIEPDTTTAQPIPLSPVAHPPQHLQMGRKRIPQSSTVPFSMIESPPQQPRPRRRRRGRRDPSAPPTRPSPSTSTPAPTPGPAKHSTRELSQDSLSGSRTS